MLLADKTPDIEIIYQGVSTATVAGAARGLGVESARIAKTLSVRVKDEVMPIIDARLDNRGSKGARGGRPACWREDVETLTSHPVGAYARSGWQRPHRLTPERLALWSMWIDVRP